MDDFLYSELFPTGEIEKDPWTFSGNRSEYHCGITWDSNAILFLFIDTFVYWVYKCGVVAWSNVFFLISSPMVDLASLLLLMSIFGWKVAVVYVLLGLIIAVAGGTLIEKLELEQYVEEYIRNVPAFHAAQKELRVKERLEFAWDQVRGTVKK